MAKIKFPIDFYNFNASHVRPDRRHSDNDIQKAVDRMKKKLKYASNSNDTWFFESAGDYLVVGVVSDNGERRMWVAKDYYEIFYDPEEGWFRETDLCKESE